MAAGGFGTTFVSDVQLKRKRCFDENETSLDNSSIFSSKRRNISQLPIRSPFRPTISVTPAFGHFPFQPGTLTPDSIPEDDVFRGHTSIDAQPNTASLFGTANTSSNDSIAALAGSGSAGNDDTEMDISSPKLPTRPDLTPIRIGRARSNDLLSPVRSPIIIPPSPSRWVQERMPTPLAPRFPNQSPFESTFASAAARQMRPHLLSTSLSPMVDAESWTPQIQRPPSPSPESDLEHAFGGDLDYSMEMDESNSNMMSNSFSELSVRASNLHAPAFEGQSTQADFQSMNQNSPTSPTHQRHNATHWNPSIHHNQLRHGLGLNNGPTGTKNFGEINSHDQIPDLNSSGGAISRHGRNQSAGGRTGRLHMGFRADCEKCVARVPGHYSHIIWS